MKFIVDCISDLSRVSKALLSYKADKNIICFYGEMGVGKTMFIKEFCKEIGVKDIVTSPTFSIVNEYLYDNKSVFHFDFYRIENEDEAFDMGYEEYFFNDNICLIEWPEKVKNLIPDDVIKVIITNNDEQRTFEFI